jgi:hypothetical protein
MPDAGTASQPGTGNPAPAGRHAPGQDGTPDSGPDSGPAAGTQAAAAECSDPQPAAAGQAAALLGEAASAASGVGLALDGGYLPAALAAADALVAAAAQARRLIKAAAAGRRPRAAGPADPGGALLEAARRALPTIRPATGSRLPVTRCAPGSR